MNIQMKEHWNKIYASKEVSKLGQGTQVYYRCDVVFGVGVVTANRELLYSLELSINQVSQYAFVFRAKAF